ncbi:unnamed protein product [Gongylonema pulchrum]|uniref:Histone acetyltransferase type B catalytic subunit n=1 Tax=Gongylonema pulchrum TaxID=637853 RepID=A0A183DV09_9BILA|nr:unnamed protein product [Gongylonema pulchrum]
MADEISSLVKEKYAAYLVDGTKAVCLTFVSDTDEIVSAQKYHPEFVYQHFGENETIFGYKDLEVILHHTDASMYIYVQLKYTSDISSITPEFKPDDILLKLREQLPAEQMSAMCPTMASFKAHEREMQVWKVDESSPAFDAYLARVQTLALWYIEGAEYTDNTDTRWQHYFLYESVKMSDGCRRFVLAGYSSIVRFYNYPDRVRPRIAHMLLLPAFRHAGNGGRFLQAVYSDLINDSKVHDITVEEPAESFIRTRDFVDCCNCSRLKEFQAENLKKGFSKEMENAALQRFKIHPRQARRVYEILRLHNTNVRDENAVKEYRLDVKRRLEKPFRRSERSERRCSKLSKAVNGELYSTLMKMELTKEQKLAKLQQLYEEEIDGYKKVIKRLLQYSNVII